MRRVLGQIRALEERLAILAYTTLNSGVDDTGEKHRQWSRFILSIDGRAHESGQFAELLVLLHETGHGILNRRKSDLLALNNGESSRHRRERIRAEQERLHHPEISELVGVAACRLVRWLMNSCIRKHLDIVLLMEANMSRRSIRTDPSVKGEEM